MVHSKPLAIYVHWPYCRQKCSFCAFNKYTNTLKDADQEHQFLKAYLKQINQLAKSQLASQSMVTSIYFGGGTPSLARPESLEAIIKTIRQAFNVSESAEVSIECNPSSDASLDVSLLRFYRDVLGINRISLGVQSIRDDLLSDRMLRRDHSAADARRAMQAVSSVFGSNYSVDLMYGMAGQTPEQFSQDMQELLGHGGELKESTKSRNCSSSYSSGKSEDSIEYEAPGHVSLYELTLEAGTPLWQATKKGTYKPAQSDLLADYWHHIQQTMSSINPMNNTKNTVNTDTQLTNKNTHLPPFIQYEISNWSRGPMHQCKHSLSYWNAHNYLGIGPGAHARYDLSEHTEYKNTQEAASNQNPIDTTHLKNNTISSLKHYAFRKACINIASPKQWHHSIMNATDTTSDEIGMASVKTLNRHDSAIDALCFGLRKTEGVSLDDLSERFALDIRKECIDSSHLSHLLEAELLTTNEVKHEGNRELMSDSLSSDTSSVRMACTNKGLPLLDSILSRLLVQS